MKNFKLLFTCVFGIALFIAGMYLTLKIVADNIAQEEIEVTGTGAAETERLTEIESDDIVFEPIEPEPETTSIETEAIPESTEPASYSQVSESNDGGASEVFEVPETDFLQVDSQVNNDDDLMLLAKIVTNEAGSDWCTDEHQKAVASVVINRVSDPRFPDTVYGVISQGWQGECPVQYAVGSPERFFSLEPSERALANAAYVLEHGSTVDSAVWQAEFVQGEIVAVFETPYSTTYICK